MATIDGQTVTRSGNTFALDGVTYTLRAESDETQTVSITTDNDAVLERITSFVDDYNSLLDSLNATISEEYDRDYPRLQRPESRNDRGAD